MIEILEEANKLFFFVFGSLIEKMNYAICLVISHTYHKHPGIGKQPIRLSEHAHQSLGALHPHMEVDYSLIR